MTNYPTEGNAVASGLDHVQVLEELGVDGRLEVEAWSPSEARLLRLGIAGPLEVVHAVENGVVVEEEVEVDVVAGLGHGL